MADGESELSAANKIKLPVKLTCDLAVDGQHESNVIYTRLSSIEPVTHCHSPG